MGPYIMKWREIVGGSLASQLDEFASNDQRNSGLPARARSIIECLHSRVGEKSGLPLANRTFIAANASRDINGAHSTSSENNDPCSLYQNVTSLGAMCQELQLRALIFWYSHRNRLGSACHKGSDRGACWIIQKKNPDRTSGLRY
jgi:hypothetical protein